MDQDIFIERVKTDADGLIAEIKAEITKRGYRLIDALDVDSDRDLFGGMNVQMEKCKAEGKVLQVRPGQAIHLEDMTYELGYTEGQGEWIFENLDKDRWLLEIPAGTTHVKAREVWIYELKDNGQPDEYEIVVSKGTEGPWEYFVSSTTTEYDFAAVKLEEFGYKVEKRPAENKYQGMTPLTVYGLIDILKPTK